MLVPAPDMSRIAAIPRLASHFLGLELGPVAAGRILKVGTPDSALTPAPVSTVSCCASPSQRRTHAIAPEDAKELSISA